MALLDALLESGRVPDAVTRVGIRRLLRERLREEEGRPDPAAHKRRLIAEWSRSPLVVAPRAANDQHYEVPVDFFRLVLGPRLKYSSGLWPKPDTTLAESEEAMLSLSIERAGLADGQRILELGCGWGSLTLAMAERFPGARIDAISNSSTQKVWIDSECARRGIRNVRIETADIATFSPDERFDRVVSVEMFEHVRNHQALLRRIAGWLLPGGRLFVHIFAHRRHAYLYEDQGPTDWMARHFFTGGMMPSNDLLSRCDSTLTQVFMWTHSGLHYSRTSEAWLANLDARRDDVHEVFRSAYGPGQERRWIARWRTFFLSCAELFRFGAGEEWGVTHYLFEKPENLG